MAANSSGIQIVKTEIDTVTIYRMNALLSRKAVLQAAESGGYPGEIRITGLPLTLDDSSIRIRVESKNSSLTPRDFRVVLEVPEADPELESADGEKLKNAKYEKERLDFQVDLISRALERINTIPFHNREIPEEAKESPCSPVDARISLLEFSIKRIEELQEQRSRFFEEAEKAGRRLQELEDRKRRAGNARRNRENELRKSVVVKLDSTKKTDGRAELFIEYIVPGARWTPVYTVEFAADFSKCLLNMRASICQQSGENWEGAEISLSTAESWAWMELPELAARKIGRPRTALPAVGWRTPPEGTDSLFSDYDNFRALNADQPLHHTAEPSPLPEAISSPDYEIAEDQYDEEYVTEVEANMIMEKEMPAPSVMRSAPQRKMKKSMDIQAPMDKVESSIEGAKPKMPAEEVPVIEAGTEMLYYNRLRLAAADSAYRGRLKSASKREEYMDLLEKQQFSGSYDIMDKISTSLTAAADAGKMPFPPGCAEPAPYDGYDYAFVSEARMDIPSDGQYHTFSLFSREADADMHYIVVPRESRDVFRFAGFSNPMAAPLLSGPADISIGSDYLLTTLLNTVPAGGRVEMGLGVEQALKVARNTFFEEETSGLIKGSLSLKHRIDLEIVNNLSSKAKVEIRERIAVAPEEKSEKEEKLKIVINNVSPEWERFNQLPDYIEGGYRWRVEIEPGEKKKLKAEYEIQLPAQYEVIGGNRREI